MVNRTHSMCLLWLIVLGAWSRIVGATGGFDKPALVWRDAETRRILFTSSDLITFDWEKQVFSLRLDATLDFLAWTPPHMFQFRRLTLEDEAGPIYEAHWVNPLSSMGFAGPIYHALSPNPYFSITNGYGGVAGTPAKDIRFSQRFRAGLEKSGVLGSIDLDYSGLAVRTTGHEWKAVGGDMKVRVEYFEGTFVVGGKARAHIFFAGGENARGKIDSLVFEVTLIASKGRYRSDARTGPVPVAAIMEGIYVFEFDPWQPVEGSETKPEPGMGTVSFSVLFLKQEAGRDKTVYRLDFGEGPVSIGVWLPGWKWAS